MVYAEIPARTVNGPGDDYHDTVADDNARRIAQNYVDVLDWEDQLSKSVLGFSDTIPQELISVEAYWQTLNFHVKNVEFGDAAEEAYNDFRIFSKTCRVIVAKRNTDLK